MIRGGAFQTCVDNWQLTISIFPQFFQFWFFFLNWSIAIFILQLFQFLNDQRRTTRWISKLQGRSLTIWQVTIWEEGNNFPRHASHLAINAYSQEHVDLDNHRSPCHWLTCPPVLLGTQSWAKLSWRWPKIEIELWQRINEEWRSEPKAKLFN